ncbi:MAG TPA: hypothetical protein VHQ47_20425, partial [Phycisphaerae bacterium]|nr:hypothetical protein [Phycisphaerae bacterium]
VHGKNPHQIGSNRFAGCGKPADELPPVSRRGISVASGHATWERMRAGLERIEREKSLERIRGSRKRLMAAGPGAQKNPV